MDYSLDPREAPLLKVARANQHIMDLQSTIKRFREDEPYVIEGHRNPKTGKHILVLTPRHKIPDDIPLILGDAVHNLRSALDHVVYAFVPRPTTRTQFPIYETDRRFEEVVAQGKIADARHEVLAHIRACRTDRGAHDLLLALHDLDIHDKHHLIVTVFGLVNLPYMFFEPLDSTKDARMLTGGDEQFSLHYQQKIIDIPTDTPGQITMQEDAERTVEVLLGEGRLEGENVLDALAKLSDVTRRVIEGFPSSLS